jgi:Fe-S cluster assembly protein SufD
MAMHKIVFIDGFLSLEKSQIPDSIVCLPMDEAMLSYRIFLQNYRTRTNTALHDQGVFVYIPPKTEVTLHIEHQLTGSDTAYPRVLFSLGKFASLQLYQTWNLEDHSVHAHMDAVLDVGSKMLFKNLQKRSFATLSQSLLATLKKDAHFTFRLYSEGSKNSHYTAKLQLLEENAEALLEGISHLNDAANHVQTTVEHLAPQTKSRQHFKGLLNGKSHSSFEGKIFVDPIAQKTQGYQLCNHLLLSDQATVNVKPNLEIFADDVKASHGATLGQLDREALFYLTSRGLPLAQAKEYLIKGFLEELSECIP